MTLVPFAVIDPCLLLAINSVRKVELHMKYIRLTQMLEAKAREYQEVCAREKAFISRIIYSNDVPNPLEHITWLTIPSV